MTELTLLTGFLGAGKTTMLQALLSEGKREQTGVIVNDFGEFNVDAVLVRREGVRMAQLANGSVFCACIKENFVRTLIEMSAMELSELFIEASGLADPSSMTAILESVSDQLVRPYRYRGCLCVADAESFCELADLLPALRSQVEYSGAVIINKADLVSPDRITLVSDAITEINPQAAQYVTSHCRVELDEVLSRLGPVERESRESGNTWESRPKTFVLKSHQPISRKALDDFLNELAPDAYRIKGFVQTVEGVAEVSAVGRRIVAAPWEGERPPLELVVISAVGIRMMSLIARALQAPEVQGRLSL